MEVISNQYLISLYRQGKISVLALSDELGNSTSELVRDNQRRLNSYVMDNRQDKKELR